jgi:hypothetical protein
VSTNGKKKPEPIYAEPTKSNKATVENQSSNEYQPLSIFQQNREKWQKRAGSTSADGALILQAIQPQSGILTRNRLQPDLVMDLPTSHPDNITPPLSSGSTSASSSMTSLDKHAEDTEDETETLGDHFAKQNQSTLKKNEKYQDSVSSGKKIGKSASSSSSDSSKHKGSIDDIVLRIEETTETDGSRLSTGSTKSTGSNKSAGSLKIEAEKSPIPMRNTQKFVSQFADLKLTGGCTSNLKTSSTPAQAVTSQPEKERASFSLGSFKPAISIKPQVLTKKKSIFLQAHSSPSPSTSPGPSDG